MKIGPYEVLEQVGRGSAGVVFRARSSDGAPVAIKVVLRADPQSAERFERERRLLSSLGQSEGFVPLLDSGASPSGPFLVMPFLAGGTLRTRLDRGALGSEETLSLGRALAAALARAHERGIVHRDLKPENILFTDDGKPLVADLGIAKHFARGVPGAAESVSLSKTNDVRGTVGYMPPEQMTDSRSAGPPADVFALGAILYECLAGAPAFSAPSFPLLANSVLSAEPPPLSAIAPGAPRSLVAVIERALAKDPAARFADGAALDAALGPAAKSGGARRAPVALAALALATLGILTTVLVRGQVKEDRSSPATVTTSTTPPSDARAEAARLVEQSARARKASQFYAAIATAKRATALDPSLAAAWLAKGTAELERLDFESARADLDKTLELEPRSVDALVFRAYGLFRSGDSAGARRDLDKAIELDDRNVRAFALRSRVTISTIFVAVKGNLQRGDFDPAEEDVKRAMELDPRSAEALLARAFLRGARADLDMWSDLSRAGEIDPRVFTRLMAPKDYSPELARGDNLEVGLAYYLQRHPLETWALAVHAANKPDSEHARLEARRAAELAPKLPITLYARATVKCEANDPRSALEDLDKAVTLDPSFAAAWALTASARRDIDRDQSRRAAERAIELDARNAVALRTRGFLQAQDGEFDAALVDLERVVALDPLGDEVMARDAVDALRHEGETVVFEDELPHGARPASRSDDHWDWVSAEPTPFSGARCARTKVSPGAHGLGVMGLRLPVRPGETFVLHVWLDPANPPREIMVQWFEPIDHWEHRASWGEDLTHPERRKVSLGPLPETGKWVRLEVPARVVGLERRYVEGMSFFVHDGRAAWDHVIKR